MTVERRQRVDVIAPADPFGAAVARALAAALEQVELAGGERAALTVVLDAAGAERARVDAAPFVVAVFPTFDVSWGSEAERVDWVLAPHEALVPDLVRRGARRDSVTVAGPIAPPGWAPLAAEERAAALARAYGGASGPPGALDAARPVVVVAADGIAEGDVSGLCVQLALVSAPATFLFDVGDDVVLANELRRLAPAHGLAGALFAGGEAGREHWQLADVGLVRARGEEAVLACAVGAGLVVLGGARAGSAAAAWMATGVARVADAVPSIAAALELALVPETIASARRAALALDAAGGAAKAVRAIADAWKAHHASGTRVPRGLPVGLERLPDLDAPRASGMPGAPGPQRGPREIGSSGNADEDARVENELAALKKRITPEKV